ncbi:uncharacterized protein [Diadema antillarum]|uniref:uncharacterized protein n=1 Tax=Diadema antillarum TaxID=105358 RepID=UPI003A881F3F
MASRSYRTVVAAFIAIFVSMETTGAVISWPCPYLCSCDSRQQTVRCVDGTASHASVPMGLPTDIRAFTMADQNITVISALSFTNLANLRKVEIVRSNIRELEDSAFLMAPKVRRFNFSDNYLSRIPRAVSGLSLLKDLVLSNNAIRFLEVVNVKNLTKLRNLDLSRNIISTLPPGFFDTLVNLRTLNLSYNTISAIHDGTFRHLTRLEDLYLSHNKIEELSPHWMDNLQSLWTLQMNRAIWNYTQSSHILPEGRSVLYPNLQHLFIAHNGLRSIPCDAEL